MVLNKDIKQYPTLTDDNPIAVTLDNQEWGVVIDWLTHVPYDQCRVILEQFRDQTAKIKEEDYEKPFTAVFTVDQFNRVIGSLSLAPYYIVAELIVKIHSQCIGEIKQWRDLYDTAAKQESSVAE